jgi:UDP-N-acetylmuramate--alanine ligase
MDILAYQNFYLVGIKGVAMTSLAQCLIDAGKQVSGSDLAESFVTQNLLDRLAIKIDTNFDQDLPHSVDCVIYTAAHHGKNNPQVQLALKRDLPVFSQAEALGSLFNQKQGVAVCGVGGKSTVSAMITWILEQVGVQPSFSVGVGNIPGLDKTGQWRADSQYFVAEADEYVINPEEIRAGEPPKPRFSYLQPQVTVCTNLKFDHPDVYRDFNQTKETFTTFFNQIKPGGALIINNDDPNLVELTRQLDHKTRYTIISFSEQNPADIQLISYQSEEGKTISQIRADQNYTLTLKIPGKYNVMNALAALSACNAIGVSFDQAIAALATFKSTMRRFEYVGNKNGVEYYDDYAHHPSEIKAVIQAIKEWYPQRKIVVAFQPHTYSRTKQLFTEFAQALATAPNVILLDIFASARESFDPSIKCDQLVTAVKEIAADMAITNLKTIDQLAIFCKTELQPNDVMITLGAGDIYQVHQLI